MSEIIVLKKTGDKLEQYDLDELHSNTIRGIAEQFPLIPLDMEFDNASESPADEEDTGKDDPEPAQGPGSDQGDSGDPAESQGDKE